MSGDSMMNQYLNEISRLAEVGVDHEAFLLTEAREGSPAAKKKVIEGFLRQAFDVALALKPDHVKDLDAIQEANLVLIQLVDDSDVTSITETLEDRVRSHFLDAFSGDS